MSVRFRRGWLAAAVASAVAVAPLALTGPASAAPLPDLVDAVPSAATPAVLDDGSATSTVLALARVGTRVVVGGRFTRISDPGSSTVQTAQNLAVYDAATGQVTALPKVNGTVTALLPGTAAGTVFVGGSFTKVGSTTVSNVALIRVADGTVVTTFKAPAFNAGVTALAQVGTHLLVGGKFTTVGGAKQTSLVSLSPTKGTNDGWVALTFAGHHNWTGKNTLEAKAAVGVTEMAVNPTGTRLVVVGNFTTVAGLKRDQIAVIELTGSKAAVSTTWATTALNARCNYRKWDSWVRDVAVSPDGSYLVVVSMGGPNLGTPCDGAVRFELTTRSTAVAPTWVASTGGDSLLSIAIDDGVVYVAGHMRWLNNYTGVNTPGTGAVPRPSLAALDPATGLPYSWNPGMNPRGVGVQALLLTPEGLLAGSDDEYVGNKTYSRPRLALFPPAAPSGNSIDPVADPDVYRAGAPDLAAGDAERLHLGSTGIDHTWAEPLATGVDWTSVRGAFPAGSTLWTAAADGSLTRRSFDGTVVGAGSTVEPWNDPAWRDVQTGSGQTYLGQPTTLSTELSQATALTYSDGRLFYVLSGSTALHVRTFNAESGIVADRSSTVRGVVVPTTTTGLFVQGSAMYVADASGTLTRRTLLGQSLSATGTVVSGPGVDGIDWGHAVLWTGPGPAAG